ncbi:MAG TPA: peptidylprolyl isomerase [Bacteroidota bacterium]|nr:peptidylprolyl isomerase [Bacteroidota bacterium]
MKVAWFVLIALNLLFVGCSEKKEPIVASVDGNAITASEFQQRYKAYLGEVSQRDNIVLRKKILTNMIHEHLILRDIERQGFGNDDTYRDQMKEIQEQALLDGYSRHVTTDTMTVSEEELWNEFNAFKSRVSARYLYARTEVGAWHLKERLANGATFEALARDVFDDPGLANNGGYLGSFSWGEMEPALDEAAFSLPVGAVSDPIRLTVGYAIVRVETRLANPLASQGDYIKNRDKLAKAVHERKVIRLIREETARIAKDLSPEYNQESLVQMFSFWNATQPSLPSTESVEQGAWEVPIQISGLPLAKFKDRTWTVAEFASRLSQTTQKQRRRVESVEDLKEFILGLATREELLKRARALGLEHDGAVIDHVQKGRLAHLLKRWGASVTDTVGTSGWPEEAIAVQYEQKQGEYAYPPEVNVAEILVRTKEEAAALLRRVRNGADFAELARKHSIRLWAAKRGGELGFGSRAGYGILADKIFSAEVGRVIGPERVDPYYGIFKVLAKKKGRPKSLEEARDEIIKRLSLERKQTASRRAVEQLSAGASISIDNEALANVMVN